MNPPLCRRTTVLWLAVLLLPSFGFAKQPMDLAALLKHAAQKNPELQAARARWQATRHQSLVVRRWPEPTVSGGVFLRPVETRVGPQRARIGVSMPIPWPDRFKLRGDAVLAKATVDRRRIDARLARLEAQIRRPWAKRTWLLQTSRWYEEQRQLLENLEPSVLARLSVGRATYADAQRLRLMIEALAERAASAKDEVKAVEATLCALANLSAGTPLATGGFEADPFAGGNPPQASAFLAALAKQPDVVVGDAAIAAANAAIRSAQTSSKPDFGVGFDWVMVGSARMNNVDGSGDDALLLKASVKLPIWRRGYEAEVDVARAKRRQATANREATLRAAEARLSRLLFVLRDARRKHILFTDQLVPRAAAALRTVVQAYANGRAGFQSIVELQRQLLVYQVGLSTADRRRVAAQADLEALMAKPLSTFAAGRVPAPTKKEPIKKTQTPRASQKEVSP